jgi:hypothetical protein
MAFAVITFLMVGALNARCKDEHAGAWPGVGVDGFQAAEVGSGETKLGRT